MSTDIPTNIHHNIKFVYQKNKEHSNIKHKCSVCGKSVECKGFPTRVRMDCLCRRIYLCDIHK